MLQSLIIPHRLRGPPASGNGGYVAGAIAEQFPSPPVREPDAAVQVTLRAPIPLDTVMDLSCSDENHLTLSLDGRLIAEAEPARLDLAVPAPPAFADALAGAGFEGLEQELAVLDNETHLSARPRAFNNGLRWVFGGQGE